MQDAAGRGTSVSDCTHIQTIYRAACYSCCIEFEASRREVIRCCGKGSATGAVTVSKSRFRSREDPRICPFGQRAPRRCKETTRSREKVKIVNYSNEGWSLLLRHLNLPFFCLNLGGSRGRNILEQQPQGKAGKICLCMLATQHHSVAVL